MSIADPPAAPTVVDNPARSRFEMVVDDRLAGVITYRNEETSDGRPLLVLDHTRIKPDFEGRGLGSKLARAVIESLAGGPQAVRAECPFLCSWLRRHPGIADEIELDPHEDSDYAWAE